MGNRHWYYVRACESRWAPPPSPPEIRTASSGRCPESADPSSPISRRPTSAAAWPIDRRVRIDRADPHLVSRRDCGLWQGLLGGRGCRGGGTERGRDRRRRLRQQPAGRSRPDSGGASRCASTNPRQSGLLRRSGAQGCPDRLRRDAKPAEHDLRCRRWKLSFVALGSRLHSRPDHQQPQQRMRPSNHAGIRRLPPGRVRSDAATW